MAKAAGQSEPAAIPTFASEGEERRFWDQHDPSLYFTEPADVVVRLKSVNKRDCLCEN